MPRSQFGVSRLDREPAGDLTERIVWFAGKPLPAPVAPRLRPNSDGKTPLPRQYCVRTLRKANFCRGGLRGCLGFASAPPRQPPPDPKPLEIQIPISVISCLVLLLAFASPGLCAGSAVTHRPNVVLIVADDLTACLGAYGNKVCQTPHLDRLAREGVRFDRAYCQYPVCGPSRASFMSGLYPNSTRLLTNMYELGAYKLTNPALARHPSIGGFLRQHGYYSARVSKIYHMGVPTNILTGTPGGDEPDSWDYAYNVLAPEQHSPGEFKVLSTIRREARGSNFTRLIVPDGLEATQVDHLAATQAIAILEHRRRSAPEQPFLLAVGLVRPHVPLIAPQRLFDKYPADRIQLPTVPDGDLKDVPEAAAAMENWGRYGLDEQAQRETIAAYYASVTFMDEQVGRVLDALDRLDLRRNTIVIFTSDHGYNLGEHHCWQKLSLFDDSTRVPLLISAPGFERSAGKSTTGIVELIDLYPTIADLAGLAGTAPRNLQGTSLRPLLEDGQRRDWSKTYAYTVTFRNGESIRTSRWRYSKWGNTGEELYDMEADPQEFHNLARRPTHGSALSEMCDLLKAARKRSFSADGTTE
jgi:iduronate 2-sulfatase